MPVLAFALAGFGLAVILFPDLLAILVGTAFLLTGAALLGMWYAGQRAQGAAGRKGVKMGGVEIIFPEKK